MGDSRGAYRIDDSNHMIRSRITTLFADAVKKPVITVCAGAGCGKTQAVMDFLRQHETPCMWIQFIGRDNIPSHFWDTCLSASTQLDEHETERYREIGFPDTEDKIGQFYPSCTAPQRKGLLLSF